MKNVFIAEGTVSGKRVGQWHSLFYIISMIAFTPAYSAYVGSTNSALEAAHKKPANAGLVALVGR